MTRTTPTNKEPNPISKHSTQRRLRGVFCSGMLGQKKRREQTHEQLCHRQHHPAAAGCKTPHTGAAGRCPFRQRQDHLQVGDGQRPARHFPAGTSGGRAGRLGTGTDAGRARGQPEPGRQPPAFQALCLPRLRQCAPRHRAGRGQLLRRGPAPAGYRRRRGRR